MSGNDRIVSIEQVHDAALRVVAGIAMRDLAFILDRLHAGSEGKDLTSLHPPHLESLPLVTNTVHGVAAMSVKIVNSATTLTYTFRVQESDWFLYPYFFDLNVLSDEASDDSDWRLAAVSLTGNYYRPSSMWQLAQAAATLAEVPVVQPEDITGSVGVFHSAFDSEDFSAHIGVINARAQDEITHRGGVRGSDGKQWHNTTFNFEGFDGWMHAQMLCALLKEALSSEAKFVRARHQEPGSCS